MKKTLSLLVALLALALPAAAAAAPLAVTPEPVAVPVTTVGESSPNVEIELRNDEAEAVKVESFTLEGEAASDYVLQGSNCGYLNPGEKCQVWVRFSPAAPGAKVADLAISSYERPVQTVALEAVAAKAELTWSPAEWDFGLRQVYESADAYLQLTNSGEGPVSINSFQIAGPDGGYFWTGENSCWSFPGGVMPAGQSCWVRVSFQAQDTRSYEAALEVTAAGVEFGAPLRGEGGRAELVAEANPFEFGSAGVGGQGVLRTITLTNEGNLPGAFFIAVVAGGDSGSFELVDETCSGFEPIAPAASCTARIRFRPQGPGAKQARLALFGEGDGGTMVMLEGEGIAPAVGLSASGLEFGGQEVGTRSPSRTLLVTNDGTTAATVDRVALAGADPDQFVIAGEECGEETLAPGESCAVRVRFAPDSAGTKAARLKVFGGFGTLVAALGGEGTAATASPDFPPAYEPAARPQRRAFVRNATIHGPRRAKARASRSGKRGPHHLGSRR